MRLDGTWKGHGEKGKGYNDEVAKCGDGDEVFWMVGGEDEGGDLEEGGRDEELHRAEKAGFMTKPANADVP
jgi:hypothetical protein